jgi:N-carbamoylputrescine amidase
MPRVAFVEWPDGLEPASDEWRSIGAEVQSASPDVLVTNEMPFGSWLPVTARYDRTAAAAWVDLHSRGVDALNGLGVAAVISSRPVFAGRKLSNEAFALEGGEYSRLHHKHFLPAEAGWQEASWFERSPACFKVHFFGGMKIGVLLCTDLMFTEKARELGEAGADLIAVPRASGSGTTAMWRTAGAMASIVAGAYVVSSNRTGRTAEDRPGFGGCGFAVAPGGAKLANTSEKSTLCVIDMDPAISVEAKTRYPCNVQQDSAAPD